MKKIYHKFASIAWNGGWALFVGGGENRSKFGWEDQILGKATVVCRKFALQTKNSRV